jgi:TolB-like protein/DNA-binding winged helix-turn-helix (wHTH) protein/Tfp pilus assembly protein PilF
MELRDGFSIGEWDVLPREGRIVRDGESTRVRLKAMDVLCVLAAAPGQVVERDAILSEVWGRTAVTDEPLTSTVGELRRLLGESQGERRYIETIPKRGYRLLPAVAPLRDRQDSAPRPPTPFDTATVAAGAAAPVDALARVDALAPFGAETPGAARLPPVFRWDWKIIPVGLLVMAAVVFAVRETATPKDAAIAIAVLPFQDLSEDSAQGYFADGLSEELMTLLTRIPRLRVAARDSSFVFRHRDQDIRDVARQLNVAHVLTGSVRRAGERIRVTAQLIDARTGYQLWSDSYEKTLDDVFAIQDDISGKVVGQLSIELLGEAPAARETDPRAYTLHLQARHVGRQHTAEGLQQAAELYGQALAVDPEYLPAWTELAGVYFNIDGLALLPPGEGLKLAREAAFRALAVEADYAPAHDRLGWIALHHDNDLAAAADHYRRALTLAPGDETIRSNAAVLAVALGRLDDAIRLLEESAERDPVSPIAHANLANAYLLAGRVDRAERSIRNALTLSPLYAAGHYRLGRVLLEKGDLRGALAAMQAEPLEGARLLGLALVHQALGDVAQSESALDALKALWGERAAGNYAQVHALRGEIDAAFDWLEREFAVNGASAFMEYQWESLFAPLRRDPRWEALLERVGYGRAHLESIDFEVRSAGQFASAAGLKL